MPLMEDFRAQSHKHLIMLDASTTRMMLLVISKEVTGPAWDEAVKLHHDAYESWNSFVNGLEPPTNVVQLFP